jgi:hypothetical protein
VQQSAISLLNAALCSLTKRCDKVTVLDLATLGHAVPFLKLPNDNLQLFVRVPNVITFMQTETMCSQGTRFSVGCLVMQRVVAVNYAMTKVSILISLSNWDPRALASLEYTANGVTSSVQVQVTIDLNNTRRWVVKSCLKSGLSNKVYAKQLNNTRHVIWLGTLNGVSFKGNEIRVVLSIVTLSFRITSRLLHSQRALFTVAESRS